MSITGREELRTAVDEAVEEVKVTDVHTHLYPPDFSELLLWGVDELITYHYLVAEVFRYADVSYGAFWRMSKREQADLIWKHLFEENSPYSEACRGVLTTLELLGLEVGARDLASYRRYFEGKTVEEYVDQVFEVARIKEVVMTNDPFDDGEREFWLGGYEPDPRFRAALRIDGLLNGWPEAWPRLKEWGYGVGEELNSATVKKVRRFLTEWAERMDPAYLAVSLPPTFAFPEDSARGALIQECVLPVCEELNRPFAMMIGVKRPINPQLRDAGDSVGKGDVGVIEGLCREYPKNKFLVTMLARENQHELCVAARKFRNLLVFGCWWFLNNPSLVEEITRMRFELLGV
ncbi:MAG: glucuronate isomerase, partial [Armatimonadota bacterium]